MKKFCLVFENAGKLVVIKVVNMVEHQESAQREGIEGIGTRVGNGSGPDLHFLVVFSNDSRITNRPNIVKSKISFHLDENMLFIHRNNSGKGHGELSELNLARFELFL